MGLSMEATARARRGEAGVEAAVAVMCDLVTHHVFCVDVMSRSFVRGEECGVVVVRSSVWRGPAAADRR